VKFDIDRKTWGRGKAAVREIVVAVQREVRGA
jgi:hypothetical protein